MACSQKNALLWGLLRGTIHSARLALAVVAAFGLVHALTVYKLEYPWDSIDVVLFTAFGHWAVQRGSLSWLLPLLLVGVVNHETALYLPLWCALAAADPAISSERRKQELLVASAGFGLGAGLIVLLREALYKGPANLPGRVPEASARWVENPTHLGHNLRQWLWHNWGAGRAWISLLVLLAALACAVSIVQKRHTRAAFWTLAVLGLIFVFGYANETRLYLAPLAFWFGYAIGMLRPTSPWRCVFCPPCRCNKIHDASNGASRPQPEGAKPSADQNTAGRFRGTG